MVSQRKKCVKISCWDTLYPRVSYIALIGKFPLIYVQHFFLAAFLPSKPPESFWTRFKTILLNQEMSLKKTHPKKFFFREENYFEKKSVRKKSHIQILKKQKILIFRKIKIFNLLRICVWDFLLIFFSDTFFQNVFSSRKKTFFGWDFFKAHLLVEENRFEAVSERSQQYNA